MRRLLLPVLALALAACAHTRPTPAVDRAQITSELTAKMMASAVAWNRADLDGHVAMYADSSWFMTGTGPLVGKAGTKTSLERSFFREGRPIQQLRFERVQVRVLSHDHAVVVGNFILSGGGRADARGWFTTIWERRAEGWRIIHDHSS